MIRALAATMLSFVALASFDSHACGIVYGDDWAFISQPPAGWTAACGDQAMEETNITLWPKEHKPSESKALIYVTVSGKNGMDFDAFVQDEIARFKSNAPEPKKMVIEPQPNISATRRLIHVANSTGAHDELVAYIEGPTAYFIVVLTSETPEITKQYRAAYQSYLDSFSPASFSQKGH